MIYKLVYQLGTSTVMEIKKNNVKVMFTFSESFASFNERNERIDRTDSVKDLFILMNEFEQDWRVTKVLRALQYRARRALNL